MDVPVVYKAYILTMATLALVHQISTGKMGDMKEMHVEDVTCPC